MLAGPAVAGAARVQQDLTFTAGDGVRLHAAVSGEGDLRPRPTIIEFSPYAPGCCGTDWGEGYNLVQVHARGTGRSEGVWGAVGPRDQRDVSEFLTWACRQPWSNGHLGLYGFSASAIAVYNSLHLPMDCVDAASLGAGTSDLYRDLLYPGGVTNFVPATAVGAAVGGLLLGSGPQRTLEGGLLQTVQSGVGLLGTFVDILGNPTLNDYWIGHTQRPGPNRFPILAGTSFYDPEARGPFESFQMVRRAHPGTHLLVMGAHDGYPAGTAGAEPEYRRWFDRYLLGKANGIDREPPVQLYLGNGSQPELRAGRFTRYAAKDWPVPGTKWQRMFLDPARAGGPAANTLNAGSLAADPPAAQTRQNYAAIASLPTASDPQTSSVLGIQGPLTDLALAAPGALSFTGPPLASAVNVAGPASLNVFLASSAPESVIHAIVADVFPDGRAFAVGVGRLRTTFPDIDRSRSLIDAAGEVVQPYGVYDRKQPATPGQTREYHVEFWPVGNRFAAGHRIRVYLTGISGYMLPGTPAINTVALGGSTPSRFLLPVLPDSAAKGAGDAALAAASRCVSKRRFTIRLRQPAGRALRSARVTLNGRAVRVARKGGRMTAVIDLRGRSSRKVTVRVVARTATGRRVTETRTYRPCVDRPS
ncbi:Cocaine esterase [Paraconexibacter sp. AEG42_29]|uniref:Cocaine esterase n=1 Tax=Paraconexibacter sp. AEG42_29 TaxID=2997339 RepID=A0AAU7AYK6_9ACTN